MSLEQICHKDQSDTGIRQPEGFPANSAQLCNASGRGAPCGALPVLQELSTGGLWISDLDHLVLARDTHLMPSPGRPARPAELSESVTRDLARKVRDGDTEPFSDLYARVAPGLYAWANLRIRPSLRSRIDPEDLLQEVWIRALRAFPNYDPARGLWLFQVAKYVLLDAFRRLRPGEIQPAADGESGGVHLSAIPDEATSVTSRVARLDGMRVFLEQVEQLPDDERALVLHLGLEGLSIKETAVQLDLSPAATEKRWQRLRRRLAERSWPAGLLG